MCVQAPEVQSNPLVQQEPALHQYNPFLADSYSFGFVLYECVTLQREPQCCRTATYIPGSVIELIPGEMKLRIDNKELPVVVERLVERCFERVPSARPSFVDIVAGLQQTLNEMSLLIKQCSSCATSEQLPSHEMETLKEVFRGRAKKRNTARGARSLPSLLHGEEIRSPVIV